SGYLTDRSPYYGFANNINGNDLAPINGINPVIWFQQNLSDTALQSIASNDFRRDMALTRNGMLDIYNQIQRVGILSSADTHDLQVLSANASTLGMPAYVQNLAGKVNSVILSIPPNVVPPDAMASVLRVEVQVWFLGTSHPDTGSAF